MSAEMMVVLIASATNLATVAFVWGRLTATVNQLVTAVDRLNDKIFFQPNE